MIRMEKAAFATIYSNINNKERKKPKEKQTRLFSSPFWVQM